MGIAALELDIGDTAFPIVDLNLPNLGLVPLVGTSGIVIDKQAHAMRSDSTHGYTYKLKFPEPIVISGSTVDSLWITEGNLGLVQTTPTTLDTNKMISQMATGELNIAKAIEVAEGAKELVTKSSPFYDRIESYSKILKNFYKITKENTEAKGLDVANANGAVIFGEAALIFMELIESMINANIVYKERLDEIKRNNEVLSREIELSYYDQLEDAKAYKEWLSVKRQALKSNSNVKVTDFVEDKKIQQKDPTTLLTEWGTTVDALLTDNLKPR